MRRLQRTIAAGLILFGFSATICSASAAPPVMCGRIAHDQVEKLTSEIDWYHNLHKAEDEAKRTGKLIFWMHMLGHIDGAT